MHSRTYLAIRATARTLVGFVIVSSAVLLPHYLAGLLAAPLLA